MIRAKIFGFFVVVTLLAVESVIARSFYEGEQQIPLYVDSVRVLLKFDSGVDLDSQQTLLAAVGRITGLVDDDHAFDSFFVCSLSSSAGYDTFMDSLRGVNGGPVAQLHCLGGPRFIVG